MEIQELIVILQRICTCSIEGISLHTNLITDLGLTSFEMMELIAYSEEKTHKCFDVSNFMTSFCVDNFLRSLH